MARKGMGLRGSQDFAIFAASRPVPWVFAFVFGGFFVEPEMDDLVTRLQRTFFWQLPS